MIKKLKWSFVIVNMLLVSLVLISIFSFLYITSEKQLESNNYKGLEGYTKILNEPWKGPNKTRQFPEFHVLLDDQNKIVEYAGNLTYDKKEINDIVTSILSKDDTREFEKLKNYKLIYKIDDYFGSTRIIFTDYTDDYNYMVQFALTLVLVGICAVIIFLCISLYLSKKVIKPVEDAWQKQQQFISDASHELKTPLTVILANTSLMLNDKSYNQVDIRQSASFIDDEARRMKKLVENLLFLAKSRETSTLIPEVNHNLSELVMESALMFEPIAYENNLILDTEILDNVHLLCDYHQIKQLLMILLDNAMKYTPVGEVVTVSLKANHGIKLSVHNTGVTIADSDIDKLFDRFYKADKARTRTDNSYGLGLSIAQEIVDKHYGNLTVSSDQEGTTFTAHFKHN